MDNTEMGFASKSGSIPEGGIEENLSLLDGELNNLYETLTILLDRLQPIRSSMPEEAPKIIQDVPLQSPLYMRISNIRNRVLEKTQTIIHVMREIEL